MPLAPGERYTDLEIEIMNLIKDKRFNVDTYENLRKTTTESSIFLAVGDVPAADFEIRTSFNSVTPIRGQMIMQDFAAMCRDLRCENIFITSLREGGFKFCISQLASSQWWACALETLVFDANFIGIVNEKADCEFEQLTADFNEMVRRDRPEDVFKKQYLLFPMYTTSETYMTLVVNPMGFIKTRNTPVGGSSFMVHIGTKNLIPYKKFVVPRIIKTLELFMELYAPTGKYEALVREKVVEYEITLPTLPTWEKPIALLHVMDKFLNKSTRIANWRQILEHIGKDREEMLAYMKSLRRRLAEAMFSFVKEKGTRVGKHLVEKRELVSRHYQKTLLDIPPEENVEVDASTLADQRRIIEKDRQQQLDMMAYMSIY